MSYGTPYNPRNYEAGTAKMSDGIDPVRFIVTHDNSPKVSAIERTMLSLYRDLNDLRMNLQTLHSRLVGAEVTKQIVSEMTSDSAASKPDPEPGVITTFHSTATTMSAITSELHHYVNSINDRV